MTLYYTPTGSGDKTSYVLGVSYYGQDGIAKVESGYNRYNILLKGDYRPYNWLNLGANITVSNGSDCPVETPDVMAGIQCAVTRRDLKGFGPYLEQEAFTVQEALDSFTSAGAYASFEESRKGRIQPGMLADFVVLGEDPFAADPSTIKDIPILATYLGGKKVYAK